MEEKILEAKVKLYQLLIKIDGDSMSDNDVDLMFLLAKDEQIQSLFETRNNK